MLVKKSIEKALVENNVAENDVIFVKIGDEPAISVKLFQVLVLLLCSFAFQYKMTGNDIYNFIMLNFEPILDIIETNIQIALFNFHNLMRGEVIDTVELNNKDECMISLIVENEVSRQLEKLL